MVQIVGAKRGGFFYANFPPVGFNRPAWVYSPSQTLQRLPVDFFILGGSNV
jgi:hypothetical protein